MDLSGSKCKSCWKKCSAKQCEAFGNLKIALVGNPNVGKSVIFNALSGYYAEVSNYPGTTVDVSRAYLEVGQLIDTPGAYSIGNYTDDEIVTKNILQTANLVVNVISAISLERDLFLTQQLIDMEFPMIIVVNQLDEAKSRGIKIDFEKLEKMLDIKVVPAAAIKGQGLTDIKKAVEGKEYRHSFEKTPFIKEFFKTLDIPICERFVKLAEIESTDTEYQKERDIIASQRREKINRIVSEVISEEENKFELAEYVGNALLNPFVGMASGILMLYLLYQIIGVFIAGNIVDFLSTAVNEHYSTWISGLTGQYVHIEWLKELLVGEFGVLTMTVELVIGVLLPLVTGFYLFMAVLEDSGYLPRLAVLTDRVLNKIGLNGRAIIPVLLGFGCTTMGVITTRILGSKRERIIATALIGLAIPCSAQTGVIIALIAAIGGLKIWALYVLTIFTVMVLAGTLLNKILKGRASDFLIDIPPIRMPIVKNTLNKVFFRVFNFLKEASPMFLVGSLLVSILKVTGGLALFHKALSPIVVYLLKMPEEFANVFIMGMIRRDFGSVEILKMSGIEGNAGVLDPVQIFVAAVAVTLFVPCLAALIMIYKERGFKEASLIWLGSFIASVLTGSILIRLLYLIW